MKQHTRSILRICLMAAALCLMLAGSTVSAEAAAKYRTKLSGGQLHIIKISTDKDVAVLEGPGKEAISSSTLVSGTLVYFTTTKTKSSGKTVSTLYSFDVSSQDYASYSLPTAFAYYNLEEIYSGSLYLTGWNPSDNTALYRLNLSKGTLQKVVPKGGYAYRYKQYIVAESTLVHGDFTPYPIYFYNTKTGKTTRFCKKAAAYTRKSQYLYVAIMDKVSYTPGNGAYYRIVRYNLKTGVTRVLASPIKAYSIDLITKSYVYSRKTSGSSVKYYRYSIKTDKTVKITKAKYRKATGVI